MKRRHRKLTQLVILGLMSVLLAAIPFENWRSRRVWEAYKQEWEAKGERFDRAAFLPPEVPDEDNFAATPLLAPLLAWRFDTTNRCVAYDHPEAAREAQRLFLWLEDVVERHIRFPGAQFAHLGVREERFRRFPEAAPTEVRMMLDASPANAAARLSDVFELHADAMAELRQAARRSYMLVWKGTNPALLSGLPSAWDKASDAGGAFRARALARLRTGDLDGALADVWTVADISEKFRSEPSLWSGLIRLSLVRLAIEPVWEGLARHQWQERHLREIESWLDDIDLIGEGSVFLRAERADWLDLMQTLIRSPGVYASYQSGSEDGAGAWRGFPDALFRHNQIALARLYQEQLLPLFDVTHGALDVSALNTWIEQEDDRGRSPLGMPLVFTWMGAAGGKSVLSFAETQAWVAMGRVACALERHRLTAGGYPEDLAGLVPEFMTGIPPDPAGGGELHYRRIEGGRFTLYSVGRNGRDDGGNLVRTQDGGVNTRADDCDWVWTYPTE